MPGTRNYVASLAAMVLAAALYSTALAAGSAAPADNPKAPAAATRVRTPLNLAVLIQDDLVSRVGTEISTTRDFIRQLPAGSRVMVGYITAGSLNVRQPFTEDLEKAAGALRAPFGTESAAPYDPYVELIEGLKKFDSLPGGRDAVLMISDGLDTSRGFDIDSDAHTVDLERAIREANKRHVAVYTFYAPSAGLTSWNRLAVSYGQSSLNRLADDTGGRAFFQGTGYVSFNSYFDRLRDALNQPRIRAY